MRGICLVFSLSLISATYLPAQTSTPSSTPPEAISLQADATEVARKLLHSHLTIPVVPGSLTLYYPNWIPGEHGPTAPIDCASAMNFSLNVHPAPCNRALVAHYALDL